MELNTLLHLQVLLQQHLPFTVLKRLLFLRCQANTILLRQHLPFTVLKRVKVYDFCFKHFTWLRQHLPFTVCAAECEAAEEQCDDEAHTLQVPERSEGKTKGIRK